MNTSTSVYFPFSDLPFNILTQILARLPVKTLLKCRAVCQSWRAYIDTPYFISKHRDLYNKEHSKNSHLLIGESSRRFCLQRVTNGQKLTTLAIVRPPLSGHFTLPWIFGACNGLFLKLQTDQQGIFLWNPFLRKSLILPPCPIVTLTPLQLAHYLIGFSTSCDDYKVLAYRICIIDDDEYEPAMAVYSLKHHLWTIKHNPMNVDALTSLRDPFSPDEFVYCGSKVYWFVQGDPGIIHSFDFNTEEFNSVTVPEPLKESENLVLFAIGEFLAVISLPCILVLEMHDGEYTWREWCSESWIKSVFDIIKEYYPLGVNVFFVEKSNTFLIIGFWGSIVFYEVTSQKLEILRNEDIDFRFVGAYVETLALLTVRDDFQIFP